MSQKVYKIVIYVSSLTGNTRKMAQAVAEELLQQGYRVVIQESAHAKEEEEEEAEDADVTVIAFWCRRSGMDDISLRLLSKLKGKAILALGTIGGDASGSYGRRVEGNAVAAIEAANQCPGAKEVNQCLGAKVCQGAIDPERSRRRRLLPQDNKHYLTEEKYQRHLLTQGHPDEEDCRMMAEYAARQVNQYFSGSQFH